MITGIIVLGKPGVGLIAGRTEFRIIQNHEAAVNTNSTHPHPGDESAKQQPHRSGVIPDNPTLTVPDTEHAPDASIRAAAELQKADRQAQEQQQQ